MFERRWNGARGRDRYLSCRRGRRRAGGRTWVEDACALVTRSAHNEPVPHGQAAAPAIAGVTAAHVGRDCPIATAVTRVADDLTVTARAGVRHTGDHVRTDVAVVAPLARGGNLRWCSGRVVVTRRNGPRRSRSVGRGRSGRLRWSCSDSTAAAVDRAELIRARDHLTGRTGGRWGGYRACARRRWSGRHARRQRHGPRRRNGARWRWCVGRRRDRRAATEPALA